MQKTQTRLLYHALFKNKEANKQKRIEKLNVRPETIKILEEHKVNKLFDVSLSNFGGGKGCHVRQEKQELK